MKNYKEFARKSALLLIIIVILASVSIIYYPKSNNAISNPPMSSKSNISAESKKFVSDFYIDYIDKINKNADDTDGYVIGHSTSEFAKTYNAFIEAMPMYDRLTCVQNTFDANKITLTDSVVDGNTDEVSVSLPFTDPVVIKVEVKRVGAEYRINDVICPVK